MFPFYEPMHKEAEFRGDAIEQNAAYRGITDYSRSAVHAPL